jgi:hypothetical protein
MGAPEDGFRLRTGPHCQQPLPPIQIDVSRVRGAWVLALNDECRIEEQENRMPLEWVCVRRWGCGGEEWSFAGFACEDVI